MVNLSEEKPDKYSMVISTLRNNDSFVMQMFLKHADSEDIRILLDNLERIRSIKVLKVILETGININDLKIRLWVYGKVSEVTLLHWYVNCYSDITPRQLLELGANPNAIDDALQTPLHYAIKSIALESASLLIDYGADVNARDASESTPFHYCNALCDRSYNYSNFIKKSLEAGLDLNLKNKKGYTVVEAILEGFYRSFREIRVPYETLKLLLEYGADFTIYKNLSSITLYFANVDDFKILIANGVRPELIVKFFWHYCDYHIGDDRRDWFEKILSYKKILNSFKSDFFSLLAGGDLVGWNELEKKPLPPEIIYTVLQPIIKSTRVLPTDFWQFFDDLKQRKVRNVSRYVDRSCKFFKAVTATINIDPKVTPAVTNCL